MKGGKIQSNHINILEEYCNIVPKIVSILACQYFRRISSWRMCFWLIIKINISEIWDYARLFQGFKRVNIVWYGGTKFAIINTLFSIKYKRNLQNFKNVLTSTLWYSWNTFYIELKVQFNFIIWHIRSDHLDSTMIQKIIKNLNNINWRTRRFFNQMNSHIMLILCIINCLLTTTS